MRALPTGVNFLDKLSKHLIPITSGFSNGSSKGPIPGLNLTFKFIAHGTIKISENIIAASKPNRVIGCKVTAEACFGFKQNEIKSFCFARMRDIHLNIFQLVALSKLVSVLIYCRLKL